MARLSSSIDVIYTRCPLPQYCPLLDRRFGELQQTVKADPALKGNVRLVSVSFDPDTDRTAVLRSHARKVGADPRIWQFASAPRVTVKLFAAAFGVNVIREADATITHSLRTAVIGPDGRVAALYDNTDWTVDRLVSDLRKTLTAR